jgi:hypothetical protein
MVPAISVTDASLLSFKYFKIASRRRLAKDFRDFSKFFILAKHSSFLQIIQLIQPFARIREYTKDEDDAQRKKGLDTENLKLKNPAAKTGGGSIYRQNRLVGGIIKSEICNLPWKQKPKSLLRRLGQKHSSQSAI